MASKRREVRLDLEPELTQVVARDFNLFYTPPQKPLDPSIETFVQSINNFVNQAGTKMAIAGEKKLKATGDAEAVVKWNEDKKGFFEAVKSGKIDANANPYLIDKYKELDLNSKAKTFGTTLFQEYEKLGVDQDTTPEAFTRFYKSQIEKFVKDNQLLNFGAVDLNKGFFKKTDGIRENLFNRHVQRQLTNIGKNFNRKIKESVIDAIEQGRTGGGLITADIVENEIPSVGQVITELIRDNANIRTREELRDLVLDGIEEYIENTDDFEYARKVLDNLTDYIQSGTAPFKKIGVVQNKIDGLREKLDEEEISSLKSAEKKFNGLVKKERIKVRTSLREKFKEEDFDYYNEYKKSDEYKNLSPEGKLEADKYYTDILSDDYAQVTSAEAEAFLIDLLDNNKIEEAETFLLENRNQFARHDYFNYKDTQIPNTVISGRDELLRTPTYTLIAQGFEGTIKSQTLLPEIKTQAINNYTDFRGKVKQWLTDNPESKFENKSERHLAFVEYINKLQGGYSLMGGTTVNQVENVTTDDLDKIMEDDKGKTSKKEISEEPKVKRSGTRQSIVKGKKLKPKEEEETKITFKGTKGKRGQT